MESLEQITKKGEEIYRAKYKEQYEKDHKGQFLAIDIDSEEAFLGNSLEEAGSNAREKYSNKLFYFVKIGFPGIYSFSRKRLLAHA